MYILGVYVSIVDLLIIFSGFVVLLLFYLAYEINKLKKLEIKLAAVENKMEREEKKLVKGISKLKPGKKRRR